MKTKIDFVTNSSSTNFILSSVACGWLPLLPNYIKTLPKLFERAEFDESVKSKFLDCYADFSYKIPELDETGWNESRGMKYNVSVILDDLGCWDEKEKVLVEQTMVEIKVTTPNEEPMVDAPLCYTIGVLKKLLGMLKEKIQFASFTFLVYPSEYWGDGWGGDPMGKYAEVPDLYSGEVKTGRIFIIDNNIHSEVFCLGKEQLIIDELERMIKSSSSKVIGDQK